MKQVLLHTLVEGNWYKKVKRVFFIARLSVPVAFLFIYFSVLFFLGVYKEIQDDGRF